MPNEPSEQPWRLRRASADDVDAIARLAYALGRHHEAHDRARFPLAIHAADGSIEAVYRAWFVEELRNPEAAIVLAELDGNIVGYAFVRLEAPSFLELSPRAGWIHDVYVSEQARGSKLGDRLVREAIAALGALGARTIMLSVAPWNEPAQRLFARFGFRRTMIECSLDLDAD